MINIKLALQKFNVNSRILLKHRCGHRAAASITAVHHQHHQNQQAIKLHFYSSSLKAFWGPVWHEPATAAGRARLATDLSLSSVHHQPAPGHREEPLHQTPIFSIDWSRCGAPIKPLQTSEGRGSFGKKSASLFGYKNVSRGKTESGWFFRKWIWNKIYTPLKKSVNIKRNKLYFHIVYTLTVIYFLYFLHESLKSLSY